MSGIELLLYRREAAVEVAEACPGESWIYTPHDVAMDVDVATPRDKARTSRLRRPFKQSLRYSERPLIRRLHLTETLHELDRVMLASTRLAVLSRPSA